MIIRNQFLFGGVRIQKPFRGPINNRFLVTFEISCQFHGNEPISFIIKTGVIRCVLSINKKLGTDDFGNVVDKDEKQDRSKDRVLRDNCIKAKKI